MRGGQAPYKGLTRRVKIAMLGSSYVQQQTTIAGTTQIATNNRAWVEWWNILSRQSLNVASFINPSDPLGRGFSGANFGVSGQTSTTIRNRVGDVIKAQPDICLVQSGTNNVTDVSDVIRDVKETLTEIAKAGIIAVYMSINLRGPGSWTDSQCRYAITVNETIKAWARETGTAIYVETNKYLCNPDDAAGRPYAGTLDVDDIHYNQWTAYQIGKVLKEVMEGSFPYLSGAPVISQVDAYDAVTNPYGNIWMNPMMSINAAIGTNAGTVGAGVTAGTGTAGTSVARHRSVDRSSGLATGVANVESRGPGRGNYQTLTVTPGGSGTSLFYIRNNSADITHTLPAGTWVKAGAAVAMTTFGTDPLFSGFQAANLMIEPRNATTSLGRITTMDKYGAFSLPNEAWEGIYETPPFQIPDTCDRLRPRFEITVDDTKGGTGTFKAGSVYIRPIADPTLAWKY